MSWYLNVKTRESWARAPKAFTPEECDLIIDLGNKLNLKEGTIGTIKDFLINKEVRKSNVAFFEPKDKSAEWIFRRVTDFITAVNNEFWNYELHYIETLQFTTYKNVEDFYGKHTDQYDSGVHYRKLSFSVQLSEPDSYEGADLLMYTKEQGDLAYKGRGDIIFFPSFVLHEVTPLISGERYSLVGWVCGPPFK